MKHISTLIMTSLLATSMLASPLMASEPAKVPALTAANENKDVNKQTPAPLTNEEKKEYQEMLVQASRLMGHIGIANIAMFHDMIPEAMANTKAALEIAYKLEEKTGQFNTEMMKLGKLQYKNEKGERDFWLPVVNDVFAVRSVDEEYMKSKKPTLEIADAKLVHRSMALDTKAIRDYLEKADAGLKAKNYGEVQASLTAAAASTFSEQDVRELPLETVYDNLILARALAKDKNYGSANFALGHASETLKEYQAIVPKDHSEAIQQLQNDITATQAEISKGNPSLLKEIEAKISKWMSEVEQLKTKNKS